MLSIIRPKNIFRTSLFLLAAIAFVMSPLAPLADLPAPKTVSAESVGRIYWVDAFPGAVQRANLDGTGEEDLVTEGLSFPRGIALDLAGRKMYWANAGAGTIMRANLDGSDAEILLTEPSEAASIALDAEDGKVYWANGFPASIQRANLDGTGVEDVVTTDVVAIGGIAIDDVNDKLYWTDNNLDTIKRANLDGTGVEDVVTTGLDTPSGIAIDAAGGKIYWTDTGLARIQRANLDGTGVELVVKKDGFSHIAFIALDIAGGKIYWTDIQAGTLSRANLDGTGAEDLLTGLGNPSGIAVAPTFETDAPMVSSFSPADGATGVAAAATLSVTFDEDVTVGSGNITIKRTSDDSTVETIDVTSLQVTGSGSSTITIDPSSNLDEKSAYYVEIDATALEDEWGNGFVGVTGTSTWNFATVNDTGPQIVTLYPEDGATDVAIDATLSIAFDEAALAGTGNITIKKAADDSTVEAFDVTTDISGAGTETITVDPTANLEKGTEYYVQIAATAFVDDTDDSFAGIADATTWSFITVANDAPTVSITSPSDGSSQPEDQEFTVTADASDADSTIDNVEFFIDDQSIGSDSSTPYSATATVADPGSVAITAVVTDSDDATTTSETVDLLITDTTAPSTPTADPAGGSYGMAQSVSLTSSDNSGSYTIRYTTDGATPDGSSTEYSGSISVSTSATLKAIAYDAAGNESNVMSQAYVIDTEGPDISDVVVTPTGDGTGATITWTTDEQSSSKVTYGPDGAVGTSTPETDTAVRVTAHEVTLSDLLACTTYYYEVTSVDALTNSVTSIADTFTTLGCVGDVTPIANDATTIDPNTGGSASLTQGSAGLTVTAPEDFTATSSSVVIQIHAQESGGTLAPLGKPVDKQPIGDVVFDVKAVINGDTVLDSFDAPVTITYAYSDADIAGLEESTIWLYHYHDGAWQALDACTTDMAANTITCTTPSFSIFALFGEEVTEEEDSDDESSRGSRSGGVTYGCKDEDAINYEYFSRHKQELCEYASDTSVRAEIREIIELHRDLFLRAHAQGLSLPQIVLDILNLSSAILDVPVRDLTIGMEGEDVRMLQDLLIMQGHTIPAGATSYFGEQTRSALATYQNLQSIAPASGYFGPITRAQMKGVGLGGLWW